MYAISTKLVDPGVEVHTSFDNGLTLLWKKTLFAIMDRLEVMESFLRFEVRATLRHPINLGSWTADHHVRWIFIS